MNVSVESVAAWLTENGLVAEGSQDASDAAVSLVEHLRADEARRGQNAQDTRNIHDFLKTLSTDEIKENLRETRSGMVNIFLNVLGDFNLSSGVRNANWFNCDSVWIVGRKKWDRRGAVGTQNYTEIKYSPSIQDVIATLRADGYTIVAAEINDSAVPLTTYEWNEKTAVIYGEEGAGISDEILSTVDAVIYIPGRGSVRSLNVATTSGAFMYDYHAKQGLIND